MEPRGLEHAQNVGEVALDDGSPSQRSRVNAKLVLRGGELSGSAGRRALSFELRWAHNPHGDVVLCSEGKGVPELKF